MSPTIYRLGVGDIQAGVSLVSGTYSDWAEQLADQGKGVSDSTTQNRAKDRVDGVDYWNSVGRAEDWEVITVTGMPFAKALDCDIVINDNPALRLDNINWTDGDVLNRRIYVQYKEPHDAGAANNMHGFGNTHGDSFSNWTLNMCWAEAGVWTFYLDTWSTDPNRRWGEWGSGGSGQSSGGFTNNNPPNGFRYTRDHWYRIEFQFLKVSSTTFKMWIWVYDAEESPEVLLYDTGDFYNQDGSAALLDFVHTFQHTGTDDSTGLEVTEEFLIGTNGVSGTYDKPLPFMTFAGFGQADLNELAAGIPIGAYGAIDDPVRGVEGA